MGTEDGQCSLRMKGACVLADAQGNARDGHRGHVGGHACVRVHVCDTSRSLSPWVGYLCPFPFPPALLTPSATRTGISPSALQFCRRCCGLCLRVQV